MAKGLANLSGLGKPHCTSGLEIVAWYSASSSVNVGMVDVSNGSRLGRKCILVNVCVAVKGSSVGNGCVAVWFMIFSLRHHGIIGRGEKMNDAKALFRGQAPFLRSSTYGCG